MFEELCLMYNLHFCIINNVPPWSEKALMSAFCLTGSAVRTHRKEVPVGVEIFQHMSRAFIKPRGFVFHSKQYKKILRLS